jgi:hypothetical protein
MSSSIIQTQLEGLKKDLAAASKKSTQIRKPIPKGSKPSATSAALEKPPLANESLELIEMRKSAQSMKKRLIERNRKFLDITNPARKSRRQKGRSSQSHMENILKKLRKRD